MLKIVKDTDFEHTNIQNKIKLIEKGRKKIPIRKTKNGWGRISDEPLNVAEVLTVRQILVLRIHTV